MNEVDGKDGLRSRAKSLLWGPCILAKGESEPTAVGIVQQYLAGEKFADPLLRQQLSECLRYAQTRAAEPTSASVQKNDARGFFRRAAAILVEIQAEVLASRA